MSKIKFGINIGGGGVMMLIALVGCVIGIVEIVKVGSAAKVITDRTLPAINTIKDINLAMEQFQIGEKNHIIAQTEAQHRQASRQMDVALDRIDRAGRRYKSFLKNEARMAEFNQFLESWEKYLTVHRRIIALSKDATIRNNDNAAQQLSLGEGRHLFHLAAQGITILEESDIRQGREAEDRFIMSYANVRSIMIGVGVVSLVAGLLLSIYIIDSAK